MDSKHFNQKNYQGTLKKFYEYKYRKTALDLIIVSNRPAFELLMENPDFSKGTPVVFLGVEKTEKNIKLTQKRKPVTGVWSSVSLLENVNLMVRLHPKLQNILFISDGNNVVQEKEIREQIHSLHPEINTVFIQEKFVEEIFKNVHPYRNSPTAILFTSGVYQSRSGKLFYFEEASKFLTRYLNFPVYGFKCNLIGNGIIGGKMNCFKAMARTAASFGVRVLRGESPLGIIPVHADSVYIFDYSKLKQWEINPGNLPEASIIENRPFSFFKTYRNRILGVGAVILVLSGFILFLYLNILKQKRSETRLREVKNEQKVLIEELREVNRELKDFAHVVSHDLKNPLTSIYQVVQYMQMKKENLDAESRDLIKMIRKRLERVFSLIEGILEYSKVIHHKGERTKVYFYSLIREVLESMEWPQSINVKVKGDSPALKVNPVHFQQLFQNLISNAVKYMGKEEGEVVVGCRDRQDFWEFYVSDTGRGIPENRIENIFELFSTLNPSNPDSSGVGLNIVKKIVNMYGGDIHVKSELGRGSTFSIHLPKHL
jgi:signal transduction histidine kinase